MNISVFSTASHALLMAAAISFWSPQTAEARQWNMCAWEEIPRSVMKRITRRSDYPDILRRMLDHCPDALHALTDPASGSVTYVVLEGYTQRDDGKRRNLDGLNQASNLTENGAVRTGGSSSDGGSASSGGSGGGGRSGSSDGSSGNSGSGNGGGSRDSGGSGAGGHGQGSNANNGGGNGSEGESPGKGRGANNDE